MPTQLQFAPSRLTRHQSLVLDALQRGEELTQLTALRRFGIGRLAARVNELRDMGHRIDTEWATNGNARYAVYRLAR